MKAVVLFAIVELLNYNNYSSVSNKIDTSILFYVFFMNHLIMAWFKYFSKG